VGLARKGAIKLLSHSSVCKLVVGRKKKKRPAVLKKREGKEKGRVWGGRANFAIRTG